MNIVFFGTPDFAIPSLNALINSHHNVVAVVTQPDKPVGRHGKIEFSPVKELALRHNIPVLQFNKIRIDGVSELKKLNADIFVTCAYGQILSQEILDIAPHSVINVHGSLLPKYRGAAPIQWSIINGEATTGITILKTLIGMDDGPTILYKTLEIKKYETAGELFNRLAPLGADALLEALTQIENGTATYTPQNGLIATHCKMLKKENFKLDFSGSANEIVNLIHGLNPWPLIEINIGQVKFKIYRATILSEVEIENLQLQPLIAYQNGQIVVAKNKVGIVVKCGDGFVNLTEIQAENGKVMPSKNYLNGKTIEVNSIITA